MSVSESGADVGLHFNQGWRSRKIFLYGWLNAWKDERVLKEVEQMSDNRIDYSLRQIHFVRHGHQKERDVLLEIENSRTSTNLVK